MWVSHRATAVKCAKEQLRMASPAEREMRELLMRIGGDDPDERSKHGVPRQQDLTQQQPPSQSPPQKTAAETGSKATTVSSGTRTTGEAGGAKCSSQHSCHGLQEPLRCNPQRRSSTSVYSQEIGD